jgi:hypothetical protein
MLKLLTRCTSGALSFIALLSQPVACGSADRGEPAAACAGDACDAGAGGSRSEHEVLLDCPQLCREVAACSGELDATCGSDCESTLNMASSLGCGPDYAGYVNCVLEAGDACAREQPAECAGAYATLDGCLCAAVDEGCP